MDSHGNQPPPGSRRRRFVQENASYIPEKTSTIASNVGTNNVDRVAARQREHISVAGAKRMQMNAWHVLPGTRCMVLLILLLIVGIALSRMYHCSDVLLPLRARIALQYSVSALQDLARRLPDILNLAASDTPRITFEESHELRDLAAIRSGASIITPLTSPTYQIIEPWPARLYRKTMESIFQPEFTLSSSPNSTISTSTSAITCWPFVGAQGTVAIRLPEPHQIVSATVVFTSSALLRARVGVPAGFRLWGLISNDHRSLLPSSCLTSNGLFASHLVPLLDGDMDNTIPVLLSEWADETASSSDIAIPSSPCSVPLEMVIFEIKGSQIDAPFTCVNRFGLLGY
ncbi:unnamed protein product [Peniophora sp. CBMAI 1063]|nr:unnamed protein product [Peniophora sp. CBMAI 1063]